jgi:O-antigen ligase
VLLLGGFFLGLVFLLGTDFSATKLPFINREIYAFLPGGRLRPFWNPAGFNANMSGGILALFWIPAVILIWAGNSWQERDFAKLVTAVLSVLLLLTQARGALLGVIVAVPVITLLHSRRWLLVWAVALIMGLAGIFYSGGPQVVLEAMLGQSDVLGDSSLQSRQELWARAVYIIQDFPLTGVGLGMVEPVIKFLYPNFVVYPEANFKHAHNLYLQAGAELGLPGLIAHLSLYLLLLYLLLRRALDHQAGYYRALALGLLGTLITFLSHGFFEVITYAPRAAIIVWGLFGLMIAVATSTPGQDEADD